MRFSSAFKRMITARGIAALHITLGEQVPKMIAIAAAFHRGTPRAAAHVVPLVLLVVGGLIMTIAAGLTDDPLFRFHSLVFVAAAVLGGFVFEAAAGAFWRRSVPPDPKPMTKALIIAEKPSVAADIARALGGFAWTAFCAVDRDPADPRRPHGHRDNDVFWRKRGYTPVAGMQVALPWPEVGGDGDVPHTLTCWTRPLEVFW